MTLAFARNHTVQDGAEASDDHIAPRHIQLFKLGSLRERFAPGKFGLRTQLCRLGLCWLKLQWGAQPKLGWLELG